MSNIRTKRYARLSTPSDFVLASQYWERKKFDWNSDQLPDYIGYNMKQDATDTGDDWFIIRYLWDSNGNPTDYQWLLGIWNNRASLTWAA